ncbi:MAG TPA: MFS transporter, partial [Niastella sp.]
YLTHDLYILLPVRFIQGLLFCSTASLSLSLMFTRLHSERAREISFSVFFGLILCAVPFNSFATAGLIDSGNYNIVYKVALFAFAPCLVLLLLIMNNVRLKARFPLHKLDWQSFSLYTLALCLVGYIMVYAQRYLWFEDRRIQFSAVGIAVCATIFLFRQKSMKRPYINLHIFRSRNFIVGLFVLFVMYICRFAAGVTTSYFSNVLRIDPTHVSYINLFNLAGLVTGVIIACCMILQKMRIRSIWVPGFILLLIFHSTMFFQFSAQANEHNYYLPLFIHGFGVGMIMVPTIVFTISSVHISMGSSAAGVCLAIRYLGFCASIGIMAAPGPAVRASNKLMVAHINRQAQLRFAMDYYELISWLCIGMLLLIILFPYLNRTVVYLRSKALAPV